MKYVSQISSIKLFSYLAFRQILDADLRPDFSRYTLNLVLVEDFFQPSQILIFKDTLRVRPGIQNSLRKKWKVLQQHQLIQFLSENLEEPLVLVRSEDSQLAEAIATQNQWPGLFGIKELTPLYLKAQLRVKNRSQSDDWLDLDYLKAPDVVLVPADNWPKIIQSSEVLPWH